MPSSAGKSEPASGVASPRVTFDRFEADLRSGELRKEGRKVRLQAQPFQLLALLIENAGEVVTRDEVCRALWQMDTFVDFDHSVAAAVNKIREALGDSAENPRFVETLPRKGYRFIGQIQRDPPQVAALPLPEVAPRLSARVAKLSSNRVKIIGWISIAVVALLCTLGWRVVRYGRVAFGSGSQIRALAVLPLVNLSGDPGQDYFADGMTEELTTELGKIAALRVVSRTSAMQYKDAKKPLPQMARELNVDALLEGTVTRSGNRAHITLNLVQPSPEGHLWTETYDIDAGDVLNVEQRVADAVAREMRVALEPRTAAPSRPGHPLSAEAQDLYFRGVHAINTAGGGATRRAIGYYQQAIEKDPNFARAYSALAMAYAIWYPEDSGPRENMPKAREAAKKALALDDSLARAHMALAYVVMNYDWNWAEAEKEFRRTLELDPNDALSHQFYAQELVALGRTEEGVSQAARAVELEPYRVDYPAWVYYLAHRYKESLQLAEKMAAMDPNYSWGRWGLAANYEQLGKPKEACEEYLKFETLSGSDAKRLQRLRKGLGKSGVRGFWQASLDDYRETAKFKYAPPVLAAGACARLGDKACAFTWLEKGFEERDDLMVNLKVDPVFDGLREDQRFQALIRRVGLP